jgi:arabinofuranan 3-O-arabinosyltransferase
VVDGIALSTPKDQLPTATTTLADAPEWGPDRREVQVPPASSSRLLVVPESINPGWIARDAAGTRLEPVTVNGWQQGWVVPAGTSGTVTLSFDSNRPYRAGLIGGLALLPLLALLALLPARRASAESAPSRPWRPGPVLTSLGVLTVGAAVSGVPGVLVVAAALGVRYWLRNRESCCDRITLGLAAGGLIVAGAALSQHPWRSVDGYVGHSPWVQLLALISVAVVAASTVVFRPRAGRAPTQADVSAAASSSAKVSSNVSGE